MQQTFDAIVIGSGQSGPFLAVRLAQSGMKTALIERQRRMHSDQDAGGQCTRCACGSQRCGVRRVDR